MTFVQAILSWQHSPISGISQLLLTKFWPNLKSSFLWPSWTDFNCHSDICQANFFPDYICPYNYWTNFLDHFFGTKVMTHFFGDKIHGPFFSDQSFLFKDSILGSIQAFFEQLLLRGSMVLILLTGFNIWWSGNPYLETALPDHLKGLSRPPYLEAFLFPYLFPFKKP